MDRQACTSGLEHRAELTGIGSATVRVLVCEKPVVGCFDSFCKRCLRGPPETGEVPDVEQFAWRPVRPGCIPPNLPVVTDGLGDDVCDLRDRDIGTRPHIDRAIAVVVIQQEMARLCGVVDMQEVARGRPVPQQVTCGMSASIASWKRRIIAGTTWLSCGLKLSPARRGWWAWR